VRKGILQWEQSPWRARGCAVLKWCTVGFAALGFLVSALSVLGGNAISVNGTAVEGWRGVWLVTLALGGAGFVFGLIWFLVFSALGIAASSRRS
jgi:hypothetical protein